MGFLSFFSLLVRVSSSTCLLPNDEKKRVRNSTPSSIHETSFLPLAERILIGLRRWTDGRRRRMSWAINAFDGLRFIIVEQNPTASMVPCLKQKKSNDAIVLSRSSQLTCHQHNLGFAICQSKTTFSAPFQEMLTLSHESSKPISDQHTYIPRPDDEQY